MIESSDEIKVANLSENAQVISNQQSDSDFEDKDKKVKAELIRQLNLDSESNRQLRQQYADRVYWYLVVYSFVVFILLMIKWIQNMEFYPARFCITCAGRINCRRRHWIGFICDSRLVSDQMNQFYLL